MMSMNRVKTSLMMTALAAVMSIATGCADEKPKTPAEQLLEAAQDGNKRVDNLLGDHAVLTTQIVSETLLPITQASDRFNEEVTGWQQVPADEQYQIHEFEVFQKAGTEIANLSAKLDAEGFALGSAGSGSDTCTGDSCDCNEVTTTEPTIETRTGDPVDVVTITQSVYWKEIGCKLACAGVVATMTAACGPGAPVCAGFAIAWGVLCNVACGKKYPNCL